MINSLADYGTHRRSTNSRYCIRLHCVNLNLNQFEKVYTLILFKLYIIIIIVCKIPLLARALGLSAARPSARATIGYIVYYYNT